MATATANGTAGKITQVIGSTFDAEFDEDNMPAIYNAVKIRSNKKGVNIDLTGEVQQHLGGGRVRCVALGSTDGLIRGQDVVDTGKPVSVRRVPDVQFSGPMKGAASKLVPPRSGSGGPRSGAGRGGPGASGSACGRSESTNRPGPA